MRRRNHTPAWLLLYLGRRRSGVGWHLLHPRPLAKRLFGLMTVLTILILIAGVAGELRPEITGSTLFTALGVLAGLVFAEVRERRRRDAAAAAGDEERAVGAETVTCSILQDGPLCKVVRRSRLRA
jgi:hypothetical protein